MVQNEGRTILVDTGPEMRLQAIREGLNRVDAVMITHTHADHIFGLYDLRRFNYLMDAEIPVYGCERSLGDILRIFDYIFKQTQMGGGKPRITLHLAPPEQEMFGVNIQSFTVYHGELPIRAYRFNDVAYVTDVNHIPPEAMERLRGLDTLILDAVRYEPHSTHFGLYQALDVIAELAPRRAYLTHISHHFLHQRVNAELPPGVELAYDGLVIEPGE